MWKNFNSDRLNRLPINQVAAIKLRMLEVTPDPGKAKALAYLLEKVPGGVTELHKHWLRLKPRAAAQLLLEVLDMRPKADPRNPYPGGDFVL